ncbi:MAG: hypothetical protein NZM06_09245 [Chloroherpetonaceae bacterium]|nr:hypothetical protein [Chloroherpetonaceae bacterium]MDW8437319.1 hypothetical protein [Chloroherpetonaceae bacterium]
MQEPRANYTAEELERGSEEFLKRATLVLEYESLREERDALIEKMDKQIRVIVRLSWCAIAAAVLFGIVSFWID